MRRSELFIKTRKEAPADEVAKNAQLLIRAGYIHKEMAGVYDYLPMGLMVQNKVIEIIRQEINKLGGQELHLSALQPKDNWEKSGRWHDDVVDVWFKTRMHGGEGFHMGPELGLGNTHEEALTMVMKQFVGSYKDLPAYPYQFQTKFRNELRSKSGLLRTREFIMKDLYSFSCDQAQHDAFYEKAKKSYAAIFERLGLGDDTYLTVASGGSFSKFSHEFQTVMDVGEDTIYVDSAKKIAVNKEVYTDEVLSDLGLSKDELEEKKGVEVGNIFSLGTRFSEPLGLNFTDEQGRTKPVLMGSYGIGPGRVVGAIVEKFADDKGLVWPEAVAPFAVQLIRIGGDSGVARAADSLYNELTTAGVAVLYDDRDERPGEMFADADLLGMPKRLIVSDKTVKAGGYELKSRTKDDSAIIDKESLLNILVKVP